MHQQLKKIVYSQIDISSTQDLAHGKDHVQRVYELGMEIGKIEGANLKVLGAALLFHDVIRPTDREGERNHAAASAQFAESALAEFGYLTQEIKEVVEAIITSSRSQKQGPVPSTLVAKIVYDADKLDGAGEVGILRVKTLWKRRFVLENRPYNEKVVAQWYLDRICDVLKVQPGHTEMAREIAKTRIVASLSYCQQVLGADYEKILKEKLTDDIYLLDDYCLSDDD